MPTAGAKSTASYTSPKTLKINWGVNIHIQEKVNNNFSNSVFMFLAK